MPPIWVPGITLAVTSQDTALFDHIIISETQVRSVFARSGKSSLTNTNLKLSESSNAGHVDDDDVDDDEDGDDDDVESQLLTGK